MEKFNFRLSEDNLLDLYLAKEGIKPASTIRIVPVGSADLSTFDEKKDALKRKINYLKEIFDREGIYFESEENEDEDSLSFVTQFPISKTKEGLENLLSAKGDVEYGLALGYPSEAVEKYSESTGNGKRFHEQLVNARKEGYKVPTYFAYLTHIPEFDERTKQITESSKEQAINYQTYVRKNNPKLASLIEKRYEQGLNIHKEFD